MSEINNNYEQVFKAGMSKQEFIESYQQLAETKGSETVFFKDINPNEIGLIYDTIHISNETENLTEQDIQELSNLDGDISNISNEDIKKVYDKIQETYKNSTVTSGSIDSDSNTLSPSENLGYLHVLKIIKTQLAENQKTQLRAEITQLMGENDSISNDLKQEYSETVQKIKDAESKLKTKQREYEKAKDEVLRIKEDIARKQGEISGTADENKKSSLQTEIDGLNSQLAQAEQKLPKFVDDIKELKSNINSYNSALSKVTQKVEQSDSETAQKIRAKEAEIARIDSSHELEMSELDSRIQETEKLQLEVMHQAGESSAHYGDIADGTVSDGTVGKTAAQALSNASSQIGVREATGHNDGAEINKYRNGANNNAPWCASFVSWCYKDNDVFGYQASVSGIQMAAQSKGLYAEKGTYTPKPGDVMIQKNGASHTGIVESVDADGTIHTIEGNASNSVRRVTYKPGSKGYNTISGWVKMS